jgi:hypothetical protein
MDDLKEALPETKTPRFRFRVDPFVVAVLDREREKLERSGIMVPLTRSQILRALVARGKICRCAAETRELPRIETAASTAPAPGMLEGDDFTGSMVQFERQRLVTEGVKTRLSRQQVLRMLVMRAARCTCEAEVAGSQTNRS